MRKALLFPLVFLSIFIIGCDKGEYFSSKNVPSKLKVLVERKIELDENIKLVVYAMDFRKEGSILAFACPCHIAGLGLEEWQLNVRVEGDLFKLALLPDAEYKVEVQYWDSNAGNVQFQIPR